MDEPRKVWVIDPEEETAATVRVEELTGVEWQDEEATGRMGNTAAAGRCTGGTPSRLHYAVLLLLTYGLGPFALLVTPRGRRGRFWPALATVAGLAWALLLWRWRGVLEHVTAGGTSGAVWTGLVGLALLGGCAAWARAVHVAGAEPGLGPRRLPRWLRRPRVAALLGLLVPGLGLLVVGHRRRAAAVLGLAGPLLLAALVLLRASALWDLRNAALADRLAPETLETIFIVAAATACLGAALWLVQILDGARLAATLGGGRRRGRGDWSAAALLLALAAFGLLFDPPATARRLDGEGQRLAAAGYRLVPLNLSLLASRLDPAQPVYLLHASRLQGSRGRLAEAARLEAELASRWRPCAGLFAAAAGTADRSERPLPEVRDPALDPGGPQGPPAPANPAGRPAQ